MLALAVPLLIALWVFSIRGKWLFKIQPTDTPEETSAIGDFVDGVESVCQPAPFITQRANAYSME